MTEAKWTRNVRKQLLNSALVILLAAGGPARRTDPLLEKVHHGKAGKILAMFREVKH
jgi:hypothetical protein